MPRFLAKRVTTQRTIPGFKRSLGVLKHFLFDKANRPKQANLFLDIITSRHKDFIHLDERIPTLKSLIDRHENLGRLYCSLPAKSYDFLNRRNTRLMGSVEFKNFPIHLDSAHTVVKIAIPAFGLTELELNTGCLILRNGFSTLENVQKIRHVIDRLI